MFKKGMYVRCPVDPEDMNDPRDLALARIVRIEDMAEEAVVHFFDRYGLRAYYQMPEDYTYPLRQLQHAKVHKDASVGFQGEDYLVRGCPGKNSDGFYSYYLSSVKDGHIIKVVETELEASFNDSEIDPYYQMIRYEFQNPVWYFGRRNVSRTMHTIEDSIRGLKELAGCKIFLKPYQLKTVMRCLAQQPCRNMIADEVGLGKTIEAASVLKIFMTDHRNANIVILVPDALVAQWKTELAFKFHIIDRMADKNGNRIMILPFKRIPTLKTYLSHDFLIVDEVHQCLRSELYYERVLELSSHAKNVLMLSATPVQDRREEYFRLLQLIQPQRYRRVTQEAFSQMLTLQGRLVRNVYDALSSLEDFQEAIEEADGALSEDAEEIYEDDLAENFAKIGTTIQDLRFEKMVERIDLQSEDHGVARMQGAIAYVSENYQLEHCIIRNRRSVLNGERQAQRQLVPLPYDLSIAYNNTQLLIYRTLSEWLEEHQDTDGAFEAALPLILALFSSASSFAAACEREHGHFFPTEMKTLARRWKQEETRELEQLGDLLTVPFDVPSRLVRILDYLDQEAFDKKVLLFTGFPETFTVYQKALQKHFPGTSCFFRRDMEQDVLELQAYRFQTDSRYRIMLSDESGGEGRNFQNADILIHIDLPWNANTLEQRIGRLDRIGRGADRPVVSVVPYAQETLEEDLFRVWAEGLHIFECSQSGLEIIMSEIDNTIIQSVRSNMRYGLASMIPQLMKDVERLKDTVKKEQHFDTAAYRYHALNQQLERTVEMYARNETSLFADSMMNWAETTGFRGRHLSNDVVRFDRCAFAINSSKHTYFVPPDMEAEIKAQLNQMQNHVRQLNGDKAVASDTSFIQGTFDRALAISNDYLHFFAPGDAIFDSIVLNALYSYKGRCAAIAVPAPFDWSGLTFTWQLHPDHVLLLENGVDPRMLGQYMGYLPTGQLTNTVAYQSEEVDEAAVLQQFRRFEKLRKTDLRDKVEHLGKRTPKSPILGIKENYGCSDLEWFRQQYPRDRWNHFVHESYEQAKKDALQQLGKKARIRALRAELLGSIAAHKAAMTFFSQDGSLEEMERIHLLLLEACKRSKVELDSLCFVRMVKMI